MIIRLENISKEIKGTDILKDINITFESGKITGIKGINGSGKTMLMRIIAGLIKPTKGKVIIGEEELWKDISFPRSIGILIESPAFVDYYSGYENLKLLAEIKGLVKEKDIKSVIKNVGLDPESKKKYSKFSLGMKQRLGIAAAIMESPQIILLDEPTNSLDRNGVKEVKELILHEREKGSIIILTCHETEILEELSDELYYMEEGRLYTTPS